MKRIAIVLTLALGACSPTQPVAISEPIASTTALDASQAGEELESAGVITENNEVAEQAKQPQNVDPQPPPTRIPNNKKIEYIELTIDTTVPNGQKDLVKYLLNPDKYRIVQVVQIDAKRKYWKFMVLRTKADAAVPDLDVPLDLDN